LPFGYKVILDIENQKLNRVQFKSVLTCPALRGFGVNLALWLQSDFGYRDPKTEPGSVTLQLSGHLALSVFPINLAIYGNRILDIEIQKLNPVQ